jgi:hypothetical protein
MKKIILILMIVLLQLNCDFAVANDTSANPNFLLMHDTFQCLSVTGLESMPDNYFLLFDYSPSAGAARENLGKL